MKEREKISWERENDVLKRRKTVFRGAGGCLTEKLNDGGEKKREVGRDVRARQMGGCNQQACFQYQDHWTSSEPA
jgi:hypothetical protein